MESELAGSSSGAVMSEVYTFSRPEDVVHVNSPEFHKLLVYEGSNENVVFLPNSSADKENFLKCNDENVPEIKSANHIAEGNGQQDSSDSGSSGVYLSTGIYIHPLSFNGNYENIIELIDVDPNDKLDIGSPIKENSKLNVVDNNKHYDMAFGCLVPFNNNVYGMPFFHNYSKIPVNNDLQVIYNTPSATNNCPSENVKLNHFTPKRTKKTVPPFLRRNKKPKLVGTTNLEPAENEVNNIEDDDVIFVKEWALPSKIEKNSTNNAGPKQIIPSESPNTNNTNIEATTSSSSSPPTVIRRRRRRRTFAEKRKNPVRKAQIDKASMDLAEKLAIPTSVFNARVKGRKPKQKIVLETKNLRQSCRTTGAILSPPRTLTQCDFKEWPTDGMHERPFYDESTNIIIKYHIPNPAALDIQQNINRRPVLSELQFYEPEKASILDSSLDGNAVQLSLKRNTLNSINHSKKFAKLALDRLQMMFGYVQELKEFNRLIVATNALTEENQQSPRKPTLYEKSLEFRLYQNGIKENKIEKSFSQITKYCKEDNIKKVQTMLYDTCNLYSMASGTSGKDVAKLVKQFAAEEAKWVRPQI